MSFLNARLQTEKSSVIWAQAGGGAAGWSQQLISLQASDEPLGRIAERQTGDGAPVLAVSSGECATANLGSSIENSKPNVKHFFRPRHYASLDRNALRILLLSN